MAATARLFTETIVREQHADCFAGAWTAWVADGQSEHTQIRAPELDEVLRGYLLLRDPVGTSINTEAAHGSYFDRISAFQEGFDAWREVVGAEGIEPSIEVHEGGSGSR